MRITSLVAVLLLTAPVIADTEDFVVVFAANAIPYDPGRAHTFSAVVRVETAPGKEARVVDLASISWLPATGKVRAVKQRPETGRNVPLDETLRTMADEGRTIHMWGPYRVKPEFTEMFKERVATVETCYRYKGASFTSRMHICDCGRAIEEMVDPHRRFIGYFGYGAPAASVVVQKFSPWLIEPEQCHAWVGTLIGLDEYPTNRRAYGDFATKNDMMRDFIRAK